MLAEDSVDDEETDAAAAVMKKVIGVYLSLLPDRQCGQMGRYIFNIWPLKKTTKFPIPNAAQNLGSE